MKLFFANVVAVVMFFHGFPLWAIAGAWFGINSIYTGNGCCSGCCCPDCNDARWARTLH